jgi:cob(I)alamin adenosyltransferase
VALGKEQKIRPELYQYFNRLSDFLFAAARLVNAHGGVGETIV